MTHISGFERSQILLLPDAVDDYVGADNPVRFIDAFVDELDLSAAGFVRAVAGAVIFLVASGIILKLNKSAIKHPLQGIFLSLFLPAMVLACFAAAAL